VAHERSGGIVFQSDPPLLFQSVHRANRISFQAFNLLARFARKGETMLAIGWWLEPRKLAASAVPAIDEAKSKVDSSLYR
jgi:hypothetical protein